MKVNPKLIIAAITFFVAIFLYYGIRQIIRINNDPREQKVKPYEDSLVKEAHERDTLHNQK